MRSRNRSSRFLKRLRKSGPLLVMLLPAVAYMAIFQYYPMYGAQIAFKDYNIGIGIENSPWVGFKHFINFFKSYYFTRTLTNTLTLSAYSMVVSFIMVITLSLLLHCLQSQGVKKIIQTTVYLPHFISTVVICGIVIRMLNPNNGAISLLMQLFGAPKRNLMSVPDAFPHIYVWSGIWQNAGWGTIIYMATLAGVDSEQHEAAMIDGASRLQRVWYIDIPALVPTMIIMLIRDCGRIISIGQEKVLLLQTDLNLSRSEVISTYVYKVGIAASRPQYSFSTAVGLFNSVVNFLLIITVNKIAKQYSETSLW